MTTTNILGNRQLLLLTLRYDPVPMPVRLFRLVARRLAAALGLTVVKQQHCRYPGRGETITTYLAESHLTFETYPEHGLAELEIVSCKPFPNDAVAEVLGHHGLFLLGCTPLSKTSRHQWLVS